MPAATAALIELAKALRDGDGSAIPLLADELEACGWTNEAAAVRQCEIVPQSDLALWDVWTPTRLTRNHMHTGHALEFLIREILAFLKDRVGLESRGDAMGLELDQVRFNKDKGIVEGLMWMPLCCCVCGMRFAVADDLDWHNACAIHLCCKEFLIARQTEGAK